LQQHRLFLKVENDGTVPEVVVGNFNNVLREKVVAPGGGTVFHHGKNGLILLLV